MQKVIIILGPTSVGKSFLGIKLAKELNGEIISVDSVQVYKGLDIGSAKVTKCEQAEIKHHLIDILEPYEKFNVAEFNELNKKTIEDIVSRGKQPIIVGGTGLYIKALINGYNYGQTGANIEYREYLKKEIQTKGLSSLYELLNSLSCEVASKISPNDEKRIIRAFEILKFGEKPDKKKNEEIKYDYRVFALNLERETLYQRINARVLKMIEEGLIKEVKGLLNIGVNKDMQSMQAIGYKEVISYLNNEIAYEKMIELIQQHSRNYAKRQMTFLRGMKEVIFIDASDLNKALEEIKEKI